jgi:hypothetical protein
MARTEQNPTGLPPSAAHARTRLLLTFGMTSLAGAVIEHLCYEPGEFCPHADAGMSGIAGNGEAIICEDNNGLRWEPA